MGDAIQVLVVEANAIYRRGVAECLRAMRAVAGVAEAASVAEARAHPAMGAADVVVVDNDLASAGELVRELSAGGTSVIVLLGASGGMADAARAGAVGLLRRQTLVPETLAMAVEATTRGTAVIARDLLSGVVDAVAGTAAADAVPPHAGNGNGNGNGNGIRLTPREQHVLGLIADGLATREVSELLCYSERTVKSVLHDAVTKLGARSRSEAVAHAVRDGLI